MASEPLSVSNKLGLAWIFSKTFVSLLSRLITSPIRRPFATSDDPPFLKDVLFAAMRTQLGNLSIKQEKSTAKPTDEVYLEVCKKKGIEPESLTLSNGRKAHWFGRKDAKTVLVYFHGGGYVLPAVAPHMTFLAALVETFNTQGHDFSVLALAYTLAPEGAFPQQLIEATELLNRLLKTEGRSPDSIIIGGDSAGGNLTVSVISHILHPHPKVEKLELNAPLRGAILISPWVSFRSDDYSTTANATTDMIDERAVNRWAHAFVGTTGSGNAVGDSWSEPRRAPASWWQGANKVVKHALILGGEREILIDGIKEFGYRFQGAHGDNCEVIIAKGEEHDCFMVNELFGYKKGESVQKMELWLTSKL